MVPRFLCYGVQSPRYMKNIVLLDYKRQLASVPISKDW